MLATAADGEKSALDGAIKGLQGWISCFEGVSLSGVVYGTGVNGVGEIDGTQAAKDAYEAGRNL